MGNSHVGTLPVIIDSDRYSSKLVVGLGRWLYSKMFLLGSEVYLDRERASRQESKLILHVVMYYSFVIIL